MPWAARLLWLAGVDDQRAPAGAAEHERGAQAGGATADDDAVPVRVHAAQRDARRRSAKLSCHAGKHGSDEPVDARVRRRLRELRTERGLTLQQVAERASIDVSTLSRLEAGKRRLALDHLPALAAALGRQRRRAARAPRRRRTRACAAGRARYEGMTMWPLTRRGPAGGLQAYKILISAKRDTPPDELPVHEGHDWLYVLSGRLRLLLGERRPHDRAGRGRRVHHLDAALVRRGRRPGRADRDLRPAGRAAAPAPLIAPAPPIAAA